MQRHDDYVQFAAIREVAQYGHVLHVFGDVDVLTAGEFEEAIDDAVLLQGSAGGTVTINLTKCRYLDSSGLAVLVRARRRLGSELQILVKAKTMISRLMHITAFDRAFNVVTELRPPFERPASDAAATAL